MVIRSHYKSGDVRLGLAWRLAHECLTEMKNGAIEEFRKGKHKNIVGARLINSKYRSMAQKGIAKVQKFVDQEYA